MAGESRTMAETIASARRWTLHFPGRGL